MAQRLSFLDYVRAAWDVRVPLPVVGALPLNKLAFGATMLLGFVNPGFWFLGAAGEVLFLWSLSTQPRFQRLVDAQQRGPDPEAGKQLQEWLTQLLPANRARLERLNANLQEVGNLLNLADPRGDDLLWDTRAQSMNQLTVIFMRLLINQQLIRSSLENTQRGELERSIAKLQKELAAPGVSENMARALRGNLEIQERRLANLGRATENLEVIEIELTRIENQAQLIREEIAFNRSPDALSASIDRVNHTLGDAQSFINQHADFLGSLSDSDPFTGLDGVGSLGGVPLSGGVSSANAPPVPPPQSVSE